MSAARTAASNAASTSRRNFAIGITSFRSDAPPQPNQNHRRPQRRATPPPAPRVLRRLVRPLDIGRPCGYQKGKGGSALTPPPPARTPRLPKHSLNV